MPRLAPDLDLILSSSATGQLLLPHLASLTTPPERMGQLLLGPAAMIAMPIHGPLSSQVGWGFANPLGAIHAVLALIRYGWDDEETAAQLEKAIQRSLSHRRPPDMGGLHTMYEVTRAILREL